jgi:hypothetical protein
MTETKYLSRNREISIAWELDGQDRLKAKLGAPVNNVAVVSCADGPIEVGSGEHEFSWHSSPDEKEPPVLYFTQI